MNGRWVKVNLAPGMQCEEFADLLPGLRACLDDDGTIWAWSGILQDEAVAQLLAASDDEPFLMDSGTVYLRLDWMRGNLVTDELDANVLDTLERRIRGHVLQ